MTRFSPTAISRQVVAKKCVRHNPETGNIEYNIYLSGSSRALVSDNLSRNSCKRRGLVRSLRLQIVDSFCNGLFLRSVKLSMQANIHLHFPH